ncbi:hypothetical protein V6N13_129828 [Hibiscus sabdariffa]
MPGSTIQLYDWLFKRDKNICLDKEQMMVSKTEADGEGLVAVEKKGVLGWFVVPTDTGKVSYANMVIRSKDLNGDVAKVSKFINKNVIIMRRIAYTATLDALSDGDCPSETNKSPQRWRFQN